MKAVIINLLIKLMYMLVILRASMSYLKIARGYEYNNAWYKLNRNMGVITLNRYVIKYLY